MRCPKDPLPDDCVKARPYSIALLIALPLVGTACGGDSLTLPSEGQPAHIEVQNSGQQGRVGDTLQSRLVVRVTDTQGRAVPGATVDFVLTEDGGGGHVDPSSVLTDSD